MEYASVYLEGGSNITLGSSVQEMYYCVCYDQNLTDRRTKKEYVMS